MTKDTERAEPKKFSTHFPGHQTRSRQLPRELLELQDYLKQLSAYVDKYKRIKDNLARQNAGAATSPPPPPPPPESEKKWSRKKGHPCKEIGFSVKEEIGESSPVQIIEMTPPEEVIVISGREKAGKGEREDEKTLSSIISNPRGKNGSDPASDESEIGIYFVEQVKPVNFVNVLQRELSTLGKIFPDVDDIVKQISHEFDHFKVCRKCLDKVSPILPDILKELQELIKFVKKKRNEEYVWPDDSEYLRKPSKESSKPFEKQCRELRRKGIRQETVGFLTVHSNTPQIIKDCEARARGPPRAGEQSEHIRKCSMRVSNRQQLTVRQSKIQSDLTRIEKAETAEAEIPAPKKRNCFGECSFLTEFSTSQVLKTLHPVPVYQIVLQYKVRGNIEYLAKEADSGGDRFDKFVARAYPEPEREGFRTCESLEAREFLLNAKSELRKACLEIQLGSGSNRTKEVRDLERLMLDVHKNQMELGKVLLEKEVLNPGIIELTDPRVLREEKEGIRKAGIVVNDANSDSPRREDLQRSLDKLKWKCDMKNRVIMSLLKGLRSDLPCEEWEELVTGVMRHPDPVTHSQTEQVSVHHTRNAYTQRQYNLEDISSEREIERARYEQGVIIGRNPARVSFSEIMPNKSECLCTVDRMTDKVSLLKAKSFAMGDLDTETEKLFKDLENEVNSLTFEHNKILCEIEGLKGQKSTADHTEDNKTVGSGSRTINLTIKIGDKDSLSGYHSSLSIMPSGATLKKKKSELSFPVDIGETSQAPGMKYSMDEFESALNLSKEEPSKRCYSAKKSFSSLALKLKLPVFLKDEETHRSCKGIFTHVTEGEYESYASASPVLDATHATVRESKHSISRCGNVSGSDAKKDLHGNHPSDEDVGDSQTNKDLLFYEFPRLDPQMNMQCEQSGTMEKLRSRLRFLEEDLLCLKMTIDRMDVLTEKLMDDAYESSENFKNVCNILRFITSQSNV